MKKTKFVIDRKKWLRGEGAMMSEMLREEDGKMCCLGQIARQCGLKAGEIRSVCSPMSLDEKPAAKLRKHLPWLVRKNGDAEPENTLICASAMKVNDSTRKKDKAREKRLVAIFAKRGIELEFIN